jgi:hypothetical protein
MAPFAEKTSYFLIELGVIFEGNSCGVGEMNCQNGATRSGQSDNSYRTVDPVLGTLQGGGIIGSAVGGSNQKFRPLLTTLPAVFSQTILTILLSASAIKQRIVVLSLFQIFLRRLDLALTKFFG